MADSLSVDWSLDKFNKYVQDFADSMQKEDAPVIVKKMALTLLSGVVRRTPVATGRARYGWSAAGDALGVDVPKPQRRKAGEPAYDKGNYEEQLSGPVLSITIINNVSYILPLEFGWSKQAPLGMVRITIAEMRAGEDLSREILDEVKSTWQDLSGKQRYRSNAILMRGVLSDADKIVKARPTRVVPSRRKR